MYKESNMLRRKHQCRAAWFRPRIHHLADLKVEVSLIGASLGAAIRASDSSTSRLVATQTDLLSVEGVAIDSVQRVVGNTIAVRSTPDELGCVGRVVVGVLGQAEAVALADDGGAEVAALCGDLHRGGLLAGSGGGEEDVLVAVVFDACAAGEGGGGEGEDAGEEGGGVHGDGVWLVCWRWLRSGLKGGLMLVGWLV